MIKKMALLLAMFSVIFVISFPTGTSGTVSGDNIIRALEHGMGGY